MSNIPQQVLDLIDWVPKKRYMEMYGETAETISKRCQPKGAWKRGVHYNKPPGGGLWISIKAVNAWAQTQAPGRKGAASPGPAGSVENELVGEVHRVEAGVGSSQPG